MVIEAPDLHQILNTAALFEFQVAYVSRQVVFGPNYLFVCGRWAQPTTQSGNVARLWSQALF